MWTLLLVLLPGQAAPAASTPVAAAPTYAQDVVPFFTRYCIECHTAQEPEGGLILETYESLLEGGKRGKAIVPGKPDEGPLVRMIEGTLKPVMPPKKNRQPSAAEVAKIRAWVLAGAKKDGLPTKRALPPFPPRNAIPSPIFAVAVAPEGKRLAASGRGEVLLLDPIGNELGRHKLPRDRVTALTFAADQALAVAASTAGEAHEVRLFPANQVVLSHADTIQALAFSPEGRWLASASYDRLIRLYDRQANQPGPVLKDHSDAVYGVAFSPDGKLLASCGADRSVKVWDVATGERLYTLGEATDWVYCVAWSPDGKHLAAGGVDKSIRIWEVNRSGGKVVHSVFAHQGAVLRLAYGREGKTLVSLGEDRVVKVWDSARMVETKVHPPLPEAALCLALSPDAATTYVGRFDGVLSAVDTFSGKLQAELLPLRPLEQRLPAVEEKEPNDSSRTGQTISLPATVSGRLQRPGDVDWYRFSAQAGQEIGVRIEATDKGQLAPRLRLLNDRGEVLAEGTTSLGYRVDVAGTFALGVWDHEYRGGDKAGYRLSLGPIPVITSVFPLGVPRGQTTTVTLQGVHLGEQRSYPVSVPANAPPGSRVPLKLAGAEASVIVGEFAEVLPGQPVPVPGTANGVLAKPGASQTWSFAAKKGQPLILEVQAARLGSPLDSLIEILDAKGQLLPRAVLRSQARTYTTFRDHDSRNPGIRLEAWSELAVNDLLWVGNELIKIRALPRNPDDDCRFFEEAGRRRGYLGTTPTHLSQGTPMYKVSVHPPGTTFPPNGMPVVTLYWRNDDGPGLDRDSRLHFEPPADGTYQVRVRDARGEGGAAYAYRLTVRPPLPDFRVQLGPNAPTVFPGGAVPVQVNLTRLDAFNGPVEIEWRDVPKGLRLPATNIGPDDTSTSVALFAEPDFVPPAKWSGIRAVARATIAGKKVEQMSNAIVPKLGKSPDLVARTEQPEVTIAPGGEARLTVHIQRHNGFTGRVPLDVRGLPHGVRVLDVGLNGILIIPGETSRTFMLYAEPWVQPVEHPIVVLARREGKPEEYAAPSVLLRIKK